MHPDVAAALARGQGVLALADEPRLRGLIRRAVTAGELRRVLAGVYVAGPPTPRQLARALMASRPDAVLVRESAAACHGWGDPPKDCCAALAHRPRPGYRFEDRPVPGLLVDDLDGIRVTCRALTALDLVETRGGAAIDDALRDGVRLSQLWWALEQTPNRPGNDLRRRMLHDSRDQPWSEAERRAHAALRRAGVRGWQANRTIRALGRRYVADLAFPAARLVVEIDGRAFHASWEQRVRDVAKDRALATEGWLTLRFPAALVLGDPDAFVAEIVAVLKVRRGVR